MDISKAYPNPVNREKFAEELSASFPSLTMRDSEFVVHNVVAQDETVIDTIIASHNASILTSGQSTESAQQGLKDKIALAQTYAPEIKTLFNIVLEQYETNSVFPSRYNVVRAVVDAFPAALRNRLHGGFQQDTGIDPTLVLTTTQQGRYFQYLLTISTALALLLSQN